MSTRARHCFLTIVIMTSILTACGPQMFKMQRESGQAGKIPGTNGKSADRRLSALENGQHAPGLPQEPQTNPSSGRLEPQSALKTENLTIPLQSVNGKDYVVGTQFANSLGYQYSWDADRNVFQMGANDPSYELTVGQEMALKDNERIKLAEPPMLHNSQVMIPASALPFLFNDDLSYEVRGKSIVFHSLDQAVLQPVDEANDANAGTELDFGDDPADPFKNEETSVSWMDQPALLPLAEAEEPSLPSGKSLDPNTVIDRAKRYIGVKYAFGTGSYAQTGKFDCSTFTKYVFDKYGIKLERTARAQAAQGTAVDRKSLRRGDLLFFYVPERFRSNQVVGHVALYMGNHKMIHAAPSPHNGVQITEIDKAFWKRTFLKAIRLT